MPNLNTSSLGLFYSPGGTASGMPLRPLMLWQSNRPTDTQAGNQELLMQYYHADCCVGVGLFTGRLAADLCKLTTKRQRRVRFPVATVWSLAMTHNDRDGDSDGDSDSLSLRSDWQKRCSAWAGLPLPVASDETAKTGILLAESV